MVAGMHAAGVDWDDLIDRIVAAAPPLSEEGRARLADLLPPVRVAESSAEVVVEQPQAA